MRRIILLALVPIITYAAAIGYLRHEVTSKADELIASAAPFATIDYDSVYTSPLGDEVGLKDITITPTMTDDQYEVGKVSITAPHIGFFLGLDEIKSFEHLQGFSIEFHKIVLDIESELLALLLTQDDAVDATAPPSFDFDQWETLGCGEHKQFTLTDYRRMGIGTIPFDLVWSIDKQAVAMHINAERLFSIDTRLKHDETFGIKDAMLGEVISDSTFTYRDNGYYELRNVYCSDLNKTTIAEYVDLHTSLLLDDMGLNPPEKVRSAYKEYMLSGGTIELSLYPTQSVPASSLSYYSLPEIIEMLGVDITINEQWVNWRDVTWNEHAQKISENEKDKRTVSKNRKTSENKRPYIRRKKRRTEPTFHTIPVSSAHKHIGRKAEVTLHNGVSRSGRIENVNEWRIMIAIKRQSGAMSYTVKRGDIAKLKVFY